MVVFESGKRTERKNRDALVLAIDVGTSGARCMLFDASDGSRIATEHLEWDSFFPKSSWVEQDANLWWKTVCKTSRTVLAKSDVEPESIQGVSVTNQRETIVPVDEDGKPLHNAIVWQDRRTRKECDEIQKKLGGKTVYGITGLAIDPYFSLPKILWLRKNAPDAFRHAHKFCLVNDFVTHKLCGRFVTDHSNASRTMLFDIRKRDWSARICDSFGIDESLLCEPVQSGIEVGRVTHDAALECGLAQGTPVVSGGGDQQCAALGVGAVVEGRVKCTTGTGTFMLAASEKPRLADRRLLCSCHAVPDKWVIEASMFTTGSVLKWFRDNVSEVRDYAAIDKLAEGAPAGSGGVLVVPHWMGAGAPYWDPSARGIIAGLTLGHTRRHLLRAAMEGVAFETRKNAEIMGKALGRRISEVRVSGGAAKSRVWNGIMSDVLGIPLIVTKEPEATALGAAILAASGCGIHGSVISACDAMVKDKGKVVPNRKNGRIYDRIYGVHSKLYDAMKDARIWADLEEFQSLGKR